MCPFVLRADKLDLGGVSSSSVHIGDISSPQSGLFLMRQANLVAYPFAEERYCSGLYPEPVHWELFSWGKSTLGGISSFVG